MADRLPGRWRSRAAALVLVPWLLYGLACAHQPRAGEARPASAAPSRAATEAAAAPAASEPAKKEWKGAKGFDFPMEPPDGQWLVDEQGRQYFVHEVAKVEQTYTRMNDDTKVKFLYTPPFDLVRESDASFFVKMYRIEMVGAPPVATRPSPAEVAATYEVEAAAVDRLAFAPFSTGLPTHGQWRHGFALADVDGDGHLDIAHGPARKGGTQPSVFLGDGRGNWRRWRALRMPAVPLDYGAAAAADFNGDGIVDLAFASHLRGLAVVIGDGKGGFSSWSEGLEFAVEPRDPANPVFSSRALEVVDWNGDGRPDLLALGEGPNLAMASPTGGRPAAFSRGSRGAALFLNGGDGTWRRQDSPSEVFGDALAPGDFNGDGRLDFVTAHVARGARGLLHVGQEDGSWRQESVDALRGSATYRAVAAADFDGDGRLDIAMGYSSLEAQVWRTGVDVLLALPVGGFRRRPVLVEEGDQLGIWALAAGDLDGDGHADLVASKGDATLWVLLGDGEGGFSREQSEELALPDVIGCRSYGIQLRDLDGDGAAEIVAGIAGEGGDFMGGETCPSGGSLRVWKAAAKPSRRAAP